LPRISADGAYATSLVSLPAEAGRPNRCQSKKAW